jgi:hypothetical protein
LPKKARITNEMPRPIAPRTTRKTMKATMASGMSRTLAIPAT